MLRNKRCRREAAVLYVEAPTEYAGRDESVFLAGGITGTRNWQREVRDMLRDTDLVVLNPRRGHFPMDDPGAAEAQVRWEFRHLRGATARLFWFPPATLCPIALFELGAWSRGNEPLFVGADPDYARRADVEIQMRLARPDVAVVCSTDDLAKQVIAWRARRHDCAETAGACAGATDE